MAPHRGWMAIFAALLMKCCFGAVPPAVRDNMACWAELMKCDIDSHYKCTSADYDRYLRKHKCPDPLTAPLIPSNVHLLVFGPSYVGQIFKAIACMHQSSDLIADIQPPPQTEKDHFVVARLVNNATMTLVVNNGDYQTTATFFKNFPRLVYESNFTHGMFMEPHPDCHFNHERCVPIGDGVVADRAPAFGELIMQCAYRAAFATHFGVEGRSWMHILAWAGLFSRSNLMHGELRTCETNLLPHLDANSTSEPLLFDVREFIDDDRCSVPSCTSKGSGHQCSPGRLTEVALIALQALLKHKPYSAYIPIAVDTTEDSALFERSAPGVTPDFSLSTSSELREAMSQPASLISSLTTSRKLEPETSHESHNQNGAAVRLAARIFE